jgi:predicted  nucleic acid-binding Zn-ribbon protein
MNRIESSSRHLLATFIFLCLLFSAPALAQNTKQPDDNPTIQSLLNEVRLLRKTLQRTSLTAYRGQIIFERMRAHKEEVVRLTRTLEGVRDDIEKVEATIPRFIEQAKLMESRIDQETDANKRAQLEFEQKDKKQAVERYKSGLERQRDRERQLTNQLQAEQTKLSELEGRLDILEREIESEVERQRTEEPAREKKNQP